MKQNENNNNNCCNIKIADFEMTKHGAIYHEKKDNPCPIFISAMEWLSEESVWTKNSDCWSFAVLIWDVFDSWLLVGTSVLSFVSLVLIFKNVVYDVNNELINEIVDEYTGQKLQLFTHYQVMPGGDDVPGSPPWTYAPAFVHTDVDVIENDNKNFMTSKFFMSPGQGNLMFQYASMFAIALRNNATLLVPEGLLIRRSFNITATVASNRLVMYFLKNWIRKFYYDCCRFYPLAMELSNGTRHALFGYFQSFKYFHEYRSEIVREFEFLPEIRKAAFDILTSTLESKKLRNATVIGVHVRRGLDLTWNQRNQLHGHTIASKDYFSNAMEYFRRKYGQVLFILCSDDLYWCRQNFDHLDDVAIMNSTQKTREIDLALLTMCNHTVMSTGTFSFWAAYLAGGEAVYYKHWPRASSKLDTMMNKSDFFLPHWIPME